MSGTGKLREVAEHHHDEAARRRKLARGYFVQAQKAEDAGELRAAKVWQAMAEAEQAIAARQQEEGDRLTTMADVYDELPEPPDRK
jgi:hypothetical protein